MQAHVYLTPSFTKVFSAHRTLPKPAKHEVKALGPSCAARESESFLQQGPRLFAFWDYLKNTSQDVFPPGARRGCVKGDPRPLKPPALWRGQPAPGPYLARCCPPVSRPGLCAPRPVVATAPRGPGAPGLLPWPAGPHRRLMQRRLASLQASALTLHAARNAAVPAVAALAGRS